MKTMLRTLGLATAVSFSGLTTVLAADAQLISAAGLSAAQAESLSLNEIHQLKINRESGRDEQQAIVTTSGGMADRSQLAAQAGIDAAAVLSLDELFVAKINADGDRDDRQGTGFDWTMNRSSRSAGAVDVAGNAQLIAAAGLSPSEARGLTLAEIAALKFNQDNGRDERQG